MPIIGVGVSASGLATPRTFLDLVIRLSFECGIAGPGPSTTINQIGQNADLVNWIATAWLEIQTEHQDWSFMLRSEPGLTFATIAGKAIYTPGEMGVPEGDVGEYKRNTFRNHLTSEGLQSEVFMDYVDYDHWRDAYQFGALRTAQVQPIVFTITPNKNIGLMTPLAGFTITGDYFTVPIPFVNDADVPSLPKQWIMAIVYKAMMTYGAFESAPEVYNRGAMQYERLRKEMQKSRLPEIVTAGGLA